MSNYRIKDLTSKEVSHSIAFHKMMQSHLSEQGRAGYLRPFSSRKARHIICNHRAAAALNSKDEQIGQSFLIHNPTISEVSFFTNLHHCFGSEFYQLAATSVLPDYQREGIASLLINHFLETNGQQVIGSAIAFSNIKALSNRLKNGFILIHFGKYLIRKWNFYGLIRANQELNFLPDSDSIGIHYEDRSAIARQLRSGYVGVAFDAKIEQIIFKKSNESHSFFQKINPVSLFF